MAWRSIETTSEGVIFLGEDAWDVFPQGNNANSPSGETRTITFSVSCIESFTIRVLENRDNIRDSITIDVTHEGVPIGDTFAATGPLSGSVTRLPYTGEVNEYFIPYDFSETGEGEVVISVFFNCYNSTDTVVVIDIDDVVICGANLCCAPWPVPSTVFNKPNLSNINSITISGSDISLDEIENVNPLSLFFNITTPPPSQTIKI